jgi:hypothetical protein
MRRSVAGLPLASCLGPIWLSLARPRQVVGRFRVFQLFLEAAESKLVQIANQNVAGLFGFGSLSKKISAFLDSLN